MNYVIYVQEKNNHFIMKIRYNIANELIIIMISQKILKIEKFKVKVCTKFIYFVFFFSKSFIYWK